MKSQNKYDSFLKDNYCEPKDYLKSLFEEKDLIVICEREHQEMTQYSLFYDIISQPWFIQNVGTLIMEIPSQSIQEKLDFFLCSENLEDKEAKQIALDIIRNLTTSPIWTKTNFYYFLNKIYTLNQSLEQKEKIRIVGAEVPFSWKTIECRKEYSDFLRTLQNRDQKMAKLIIRWHKHAKDNHVKSKALIIMNFRHAYANKYATSKKRLITNNVGRYLKDSLPDKMTNIFLNRYTYTKFLGIQKKHQRGKWDNAFFRNNNKPIGFKFGNSPFGNDVFDDFPYSKTDLMWKDVFDHMIFYNPIKEFINSYGISGIIDENFKNELKRRFRLCGSTLSNRRIKKINTERTN